MAASLINSLFIKINEAPSEMNLVSHIETLDANKISEAIAWTKKYLIAPSKRANDCEISIRGIKDIIFTSKEIQINSQLDLLITKIVLATIINEIRVENGNNKSIGVWRSWTT